MDLWIRVENEHGSSIQKVDGVRTVFDLSFLDWKEWEMLEYQYSAGMCGIFGKCDGKEVLLGLYDKKTCISIVNEIYSRLLGNGMCLFENGNRIIVFSMPEMRDKGDSENEK